MASDDLRLSRFVVFVDHGEHVEIQHAARGGRWRVERVRYEQLRRFAAFRPYESGVREWVDAGVLVPPFTDTLANHAAGPGSEAAMAADYLRWYWRHEVESEREYRWFGEVAVKMPSDLFYLQEVLAESPRRRVLELGRGRGGGLWYLASILHLLGGGELVSIELDALAPSVDCSQWNGVDVHTLVADAFSEDAVTAVTAVVPAVDLMVLDLGGEPRRNLAALPNWAGLVADKGTVVVEDLWGEDEERVVRALDEFLVARRDFSLCTRGARHPLLKGIGLRRTTRVHSPERPPGGGPHPARRSVWADERRVAARLATRTR